MLCKPLFLKEKIIIFITGKLSPAAGLSRPIALKTLTAKESKRGTTWEQVKSFRL
jgi:hypothetical protein